MEDEDLRLPGYEPPIDRTDVSVSDRGAGSRSDAGPPLLDSPGKPATPSERAEEPKQEEAKA
jgi:hypothetical protein